MSGNSRIDFPLLPTTRPYPLLPLAHVPPCLYWLGTSGWCLSLVRAPLPCESMVCLSFMHFPLPVDLSGLTAHFYYLFFNPLWCGWVWVLLGHRPFLLQFDSCFLLFLVCGLTSILIMPLHCFCHAITWFVLARPPLSLPCTFPLFSSRWPVFLLG